MNHIETLLMLKIREALKIMQARGVGYIDYEMTGELHYIIDDKSYKITIKEECNDV